MIPRINNCLVCEIVREELNNKLIILGLYGVCPDVDVRLQRLDQPAVLTFVFTGSPGEGLLSVVFDVLDERDSRVLASTPALPFQAIATSNTTLAATLVTTFGHPGVFAARLTVDGQEAHRAEFRVAEGLLTTPTA